MDHIFKHLFENGPIFKHMFENRPYLAHPIFKVAIRHFFQTFTIWQGTQVTNCPINYSITVIRGKKLGEISIALDVNHTLNFKIHRKNLLIINNEIKKIFYLK